MSTDTNGHSPSNLYELAWMGVKKNGAWATASIALVGFLIYFGTQQLGSVIKQQDKSREFIQTKLLDVAAEQATVVAQSTEQLSRATDAIEETVEQGKRMVKALEENTATNDRVVTAVDDLVECTKAMRDQ